MSASVQLGLGIGEAPQQAQMFGSGTGREMRRTRTVPPCSFCPRPSVGEAVALTGESPHKVRVCAEHYEKAYWLMD